MKKTIYWNVNGGTGLNYSLSHFMKELKENYEKVCVMSPYSDIFEYNPYVDEVYKPEQGRDFIFDAKDDDAEIVTTRIYDLSDFIYKKLNYEDGWREMAKLPSKDRKSNYSDLKNVLNYDKPIIRQYIEQIQKHLADKGYEDFIIAQFNGGQSPLTNVPLNEKQEYDWSKVPYNVDNEPLQRHYPLEKAQEFVTLFREEHPKTAVIYYGLPNEYHLVGVEQFQIPYIIYGALVQENNCKGIVAIDSSLQHQCAGLTKGVVIWGHSLPDAFGYSCYKNIIQKCRRDDILYMSLLGPSSAKITYINPKDLLKSVDEELFTIIDEEKKDEQ